MSQKKHFGEAGYKINIDIHYYKGVFAIKTWQQIHSTYISTYISYCALSTSNECL